MSTLAKLARDLAEAESTIPWNSGPARSIIARVTAELRALAERPTPEDAALVEGAVDLLFGVSHPDTAPTILALRALAARLAAQQPAPVEQPAASPWPPLERPCHDCRPDQAHYCAYCHDTRRVPTESGLALLNFMHEWMTR